MKNCHAFCSRDERSMETLRQDGPRKQIADAIATDVALPQPVAKWQRAISVRVAISPHGPTPRHVTAQFADRLSRSTTCTDLHRLRRRIGLAVATCAMANRSIAPRTSRPEIPSFNVSGRLQRFRRAQVSLAHHRRARPPVACGRGHRPGRCRRRHVRRLAADRRRVAAHRVFSPADSVSSAGAASCCRRLAGGAPDDDCNAGTVEERV